MYCFIDKTFLIIIMSDIMLININFNITLIYIVKSAK